ncbi:MAG: nitrogenase component 1 [Anaerostipes sp.]|nr:nitrogenase component 1 [Anaerostipes sp.]
MAALMSLDDAVFIAHSPQGCVGCTSLAVDQFRVGQAHRGVKHIRNPRIIVTNLDQKSVIFGGESRLEKAVQDAVERYHPKLIFIFASCASGIIGDDIDASARKLQEKYDALIIPIHCEGFKSKICASGFDAAFIAINKYILKNKKREKQDNLINLFAPVSISYADQKEMEKIQRIPSAAASTSICKVFADEFMKTLEEDYGIPYSHTVMPIGVRNTDKWFLGIAKVVGKEKEALEIIQKEHKRILPLVQEIKERLQISWKIQDLIKNWLHT